MIHRVLASSEQLRSQVGSHSREHVVSSSYCGMEVLRAARQDERVWFAEQQSYGSTS
jgi:hypothetical protein